jgi:hypothetical protein
MHIEKFSIGCVLLISLLHYSQVCASNPESHAEGERTKTRVVVVGFGKGNLTSNYYMDDSLSKFTRIPQDSLHQSFSRAVVENFKPGISNRVDFITCSDPRQERQFAGLVRYVPDGDERRADFSEASVSGLLASTRADYLLFISQYEINYILSPYQTFYYIVRYALLNAKSEILYEGRVFFENADIVPLNQLVRKHEKQTQRIVNQTEKLLSDR